MHIGNLVLLLTMRRFQLFGHRPIGLVGGATGLIGDPSGKSAERVLNPRDLVATWVDRIRGEVERFLAFGDADNSALIVSNLDWTAGLSALDFLRDIGKHFPVNQMLARESVKARLEAGGISYTEFSYQVLQALDYLELYRRHDTTLQVGGSDQWGNLVAGVDLIRRAEGAPVHALATPLITKPDGTKYGKTEGGAIWISPDLMSPYASTSSGSTSATPRCRNCYASSRSGPGRRSSNWSGRRPTGRRRESASALWPRTSRASCTVLTPCSG